MLGTAQRAGETWAEVEAVDATGQVSQTRLRFTVVEPDAAEAPAADSPTRWAGRTSRDPRLGSDASPDRRALAPWPATSELPPIAELPDLGERSVRTVPEGGWVKVNANLFNECVDARRPCGRVGA